MLWEGVAHAWRGGARAVDTTLPYPQHILPDFIIYVNRMLVNVRMIRRRSGAFSSGQAHPDTGVKQYLNRVIRVSLVQI